jgi:hypothetical protein
VDSKGGNDFRLSLDLQLSLRGLNITTLADVSDVNGQMF